MKALQTFLGLSEINYILFLLKDFLFHLFLFLRSMLTFSSTIITSEVDVEEIRIKSDAKKIKYYQISKSYWPKAYNNFLISDKVGVFYLAVFFIVIRRQ